MKVIYDTDIGSDIDDAVCLAYLLAQPQCELLGIVTETEIAQQRAMLASVLCRVAGQSIPIFPGTQLPLLGEPHQTTVPQAKALARWEHDTNFPQGEAIEWMRQTIRAHPGEITLLATGPMTNIALLFASDPEIPALLQSFVMMCGAFTKRSGQGWVEWNALCDPHAAAIVYQASTKVHRSIGLDVTEHVTMPAHEVRQRFQGEILRPVLDFAQSWFEGIDHITFHDPLAGAILFDDEICGFSRGLVEVETQSSRLMGFTNWQPDADGPHEVATQVSPQRFFEHFFKICS